MLKYFYFALKIGFCNTQPFFKILFWRKLVKLLKLGVHCFAIFTKIKYLEFSLLFVLLVWKYYFYIKKLLFLLYISTS